MAGRSKARKNLPKEQRELFNPLQEQVNKMKADLKEMKKRFNSRQNRFVPRYHKGEVIEIDLASAWPVVSRMLKKCGISEEEAVLWEEYKARSKDYFEQKKKIALLANEIEKIDTGHIYRHQPVLQRKGGWIIEQLGQFRSLRDVFNDLTKKQGLSIGWGSYKSFTTEQKKEIDKYREEFKTELFSSSIATDAGRLKFYEEAYTYYYDVWKRDGKVSDFNACAKIAEAVRAEIKGDLTIKIDGKIDITHSIEANKTLAQKFGELNVSLITIGLAAQKSNVNPIPLMAQLSQSYYNRWNGVSSKPLGLEDKAELIPISGLVKSYNWEEIQEKNADGYNPGVIEDAIVIKDEKEMKKIDNKKAALLEKILEKQTTKLLKKE